METRDKTWIFFTVLFSALIVLLALAGCGKKGDLFLPEQNTEVSSSKQQPPQEDQQPKKKKAETETEN